MSKIANAPIPVDLLKEILALPEGTVIHAASISVDQYGERRLVLTIEHESLPENPIGLTPPTVSYTIQMVQVHRFVSWNGFVRR